MCAMDIWATNACKVWGKSRMRATYIPDARNPIHPPHLVLAVRRHNHTQLSQSLLHRITWHEAYSVAQNELDEHLKGGADKFGNTLLHYKYNK